MQQTLPTTRACAPVQCRGVARARISASAAMQPTRGPAFAAKQTVRTLIALDHLLPWLAGGPQRTSSFWAACSAWK